ncbi:MAG: DUF3853 family protein, partial [Bacteroidales bacterium]|nr:DUF3853 family protein [Bacteroidales bacterium]
RRNSQMLVQLTVSELIEYLKTEFPMLTKPVVEKAPEPAPEPEKKKDGPTFTGRLLYGIKGIEDHFDVCHKTAWEWKESWLKPAVKQRGRKIIVDLAYAMKLFSFREGKNIKKLPPAKAVKNAKKK